MRTLVIDSFNGSNPTFKDLSWTVRAMSKDPIKINLNAVYINAGNMVASDGHRMHLAEINLDGTPLEEGLYEVIKNSKDQIILQEIEGEGLPNYKQVIPEGETQKTVELVFENPRKGKANHSRTYSQTIRALKENLVLDYNLFSQAIEGMDTATFKVFTDNGPVVLKSGNKLAVIMPMKIKE
jgi:DNA polymerase III sliding clamp (beta) subunit (PCNA family)